MHASLYLHFYEVQLYFPYFTENTIQQTKYICCGAKYHFVIF